MITKIDSIMIASMLGNKYVGIYSVVAYVSMFIEIPRRAIKQFSYPALANSLAKQEFDTVSKIYKDISLYQFAIGFLIFTVIVGNLDDIFLIIPRNSVYSNGKLVAIYIAFSKLANMMFGVSSDVIVMSSKFRYNFFTVIMLLFLTIFTNYIMIPLFGIDGAAMATLLSLLVYDLFSYFLVFAKFKIHAFSRKSLLVTTAGLITLAISKLVPHIGTPFWHFAAKVLVMCICYTALLLSMNVFPSLRDKVKNIIKG